KTKLFATPSLVDIVMVGWMKCQTNPAAGRHCSPRRATKRGGPATRQSAPGHWRRALAPMVPLRAPFAQSQSGLTSGAFLGLRGPGGQNELLNLMWRVQLKKGRFSEVFCGSAVSRFSHFTVFHMGFH